MVSTAGIAVWVPVLQHRCGHMVRWMHLCGVDAPHAVSTRRKRHGPAQNHLPRPWDTNRRRMACKSACLSSLFFPPIVEGKREVLFAIISKNTGLLRFLYFTFFFFFFSIGSRFYRSLVLTFCVSKRHRATPNCRTMSPLDSSPGHHCGTFSRQRPQTP